MIFQVIEVKREKFSSLSWSWTSFELVWRGEGEEWSWSWCRLVMWVYKPFVLYCYQYYMKYYFRWQVEVNRATCLLVPWQWQCQVRGRGRLLEVLSIFCSMTSSFLSLAIKSLKITLSGYWLQGPKKVIKCVQFVIWFSSYDTCENIRDVFLCKIAAIRQIANWLCAAGITRGDCCGCGELLGSWLGDTLSSQVLATSASHLRLITLSTNNWAGDWYSEVHAAKCLLPSVLLCC